MVAIIDRLDRYWAWELGCSPDALHAGGVTVAAPPHREGPRWMGWLVPLECVVLDCAPSGTGVVSVTPTVTADLAQYLESPQLNILPPHGDALTPFIRAHFPHSYPKVHRILQCDHTSFAPAPEVLPISMLDDSDIHASWYRLHFDGPIFVARDERGSIASWAAIKCKSEEVWEMAVVTELRYRGRGLARSVVSRATIAALDAGKVPLYLHDLSNHASAHVCGALGYQPYGYELTCESGRVMPNRSYGSG
jgi:hypothetical protein